MACANGHIGSWEQFDAPAPAKSTAAANARAYASAAVAAGTAGKLVRLGDVTTEARTRVKTGIEEFDRAAGGGLMPASLVLIAGAPGEGKCVVGSTRVLDPKTGDYLPISEWANTKHDSVLALNPSDLKIAEVSGVELIPQGSKEIVRVMTRLGKVLRCTPSHPVFTIDGWKAVGSLKPGDRLAAPRELGVFGNEKMSDDEVKLIAYALGDGHLANCSLSVTTALPEIAEDLAGIAERLDMKLSAYPRKGSKATTYRFTKSWLKRAETRQEVFSLLDTARIQSGFSWSRVATLSGVDYRKRFGTFLGRHSVPSEAALRAISGVLGVDDQSIQELASHARYQPLTAQLMKASGLKDSRAANKHVPAAIFRLPKSQMALFLNILYSCDGTVSTTEEGRGIIDYYTISRRLAEDVQHLLLRFGLVATLRSKKTKFNGKDYLSFVVSIQNHGSALRFLQEIGIKGRYQNVATVLEANRPKIQSSLKDTVPTGPKFWREIRKAAGTQGLSGLARDAQTALHPERVEGPMARRSVQALASAAPDNQYLRTLGDSDVYWDEIANIEPDGEEEVFDLSVPGAHNFVANDLIIHNSTLLAQVVDALVQQGYGAIYASGEESAGQIRERAERLKLHLNDIRVVTEQDANVICEIIATEHPQFCVIDSIQTFSPSLDAPAGTISSVQRVAHMFLKTAKAAGTTLLIVGQINKDSNIAGPEALQHLVDTVLFLEGDKNGFLRILRATKNRFGPLDEIGLFDMREEGMVGISAPAPLHLEGGEAYGRCVCPAMEGTRAILVEVQALVAKAAYGTARRVAIGVPAPRVAMLLAVLERYAKIDLSNHDVYVQISGGISVNEPGIDLAVCAAIASSYWSHPLPRDSVSLGEVGLGGELRPVRQITSRIKEATRQGFNLVVGPKADNLPAGAYRAFSDVAAALGALDVLAPKDGEPVKGGMPLRTRAAIMMRNKRDGSDND